MPTTRNRQFARDGQRQEGSQWACPHCCQVAESTGQAAMTDRLGRMPVASKVHVLKRKVSGDGDLFSPRGTQQGAVIAYAKDQFFARASASRADRGNHRQFSVGEGGRFSGNFAV